MNAEMIYFDMDGVLADFNNGVREICGMEPLNQNTMTPELKPREDEMFSAMREAGDFYYRLKPIPGSLELFRELYDKYGDRCQILTGIPKPHRGLVTAGDDKRRWVGRLISDKVVTNIVFSEQKKDFCRGKGSILIDDYTKNIRAWEEMGGTGILCTDIDGVRSRLRELGVL